MEQYVRTAKTQAPSHKGASQPKPSGSSREAGNIETNTGGLGSGQEHPTRIRTQGPQRNPRLSDEAIAARIRDLSQTLGFDVMQEMSRKVIEFIEAKATSCLIACIEFEDSPAASKIIQKLAQTWN
jgi:hypothetical protein